ncbi:alpha/beta fold hydrolase [Streptomyces sp. VNUA24]|uniref:alpha/beta hydrolase n=1 Tax=Streptomyces sp. VNUA24 TaxID=3031131 RepID=UPI0023B78318|nr:alpha/beta fold hydrolase [Streptomyces sp. VNUA24]WEH12245.1 alpha/beta fold hydrolase [Streptomyces sp. VNUA24]
MSRSPAPNTSASRDIVLRSGDEWLALSLDEPDQAPRAAVVLCHGMGGDRVGPGGLFPQLGQAAVEAGCAAVRFDFRGAGESSGAAESATLASMVDDASQVVAWARSTLGCSRVLIAGHSIGGLVAAALATRSPAEVHAALLMACDIGRYDYSAGSPVFFAQDSMYFPHAFAAERARTDLLTARFTCPVAYIGGTLERPGILNTMRRLSDAGHAVARIADADHLFSAHRTELASTATGLFHRLLVSPTESAS